MFVSEKLIFLQLQKTAGTHIAAQLQRHLGGAMHGKHGPLDFDPGQRLIVGSVRCPWDWYVSLWAYGCGAQGGVQGLLKGSRASTALRIAGKAWRRPFAWSGALRDLAAHAGRDVGFWRDGYADPQDPARFRCWLRAVLSPQGRRLLGSDYADRSLSDFAALYTYRFLRVFTPSATWHARVDDIRHRRDIGPWFEAYGAPQMFVRNERLEEDLAEVFTRIGRPDITAEVLRGERTNSSRRGKLESYYDADTLALVAESDPFLIERFGYCPPRLAESLE